MRGTEQFSSNWRKGAVSEPLHHGNESMEPITSRRLIARMQRENPYLSFVSLRFSLINDVYNL